MNWATVAPETRLYKGKALYRWELSPGVHHHCGTCATPLSNAHAKTTCLGKHVEPCYRFHQQLHFVGKSHECFGCNSSDEKHHQRHKEILKIVRQINLHDQVSSPFPLCKAGRDGKQRWDSPFTISSPTDTGSESVDNEEFKITKRARKRAKKAGNGPARDKQNLEIFPKEETDFISEAIHLSIHESKGAWEGTYVYTHQKLEAEDSSEIVEKEPEQDEFESFNARMESLAVKAPGAMTPRQRKVIKKFTTPINHSSFGGGSRKYSGRSPNVEFDPYDGVEPAIFFRLGIEVVDPVHNSRARKELVTKLVSAVKEDLEIIEREESESALREEGFWRWAGRTAYHSILDIRTELDWATGQKKGVSKRPKAFQERWIESEEFTEETLEKSPVHDTTGLESPGKENEEPSSGYNSDSELQLSAKIAIENKSPTIPKYLLDDEGDEWTTVGAKCATTTKNPHSTRPTLKFKSNHAIIEEEGETFAEMVSRHNQRVAGKSNIGGHRSVFGSTPDLKKGSRSTTLKLK